MYVSRKWYLYYMSFASSTSYMHTKLFNKKYIPQSIWTTWQSVLRWYKDSTSLRAVSSFSAFLDCWSKQQKIMCQYKLLKTCTMITQKNTRAHDTYLNLQSMTVINFVGCVGCFWCCLLGWIGSWCTSLWSNTQKIFFDHFKHRQAAAATWCWKNRSMPKNLAVFLWLSFCISRCFLLHFYLYIIFSWSDSCFHLAPAIFMSSLGALAGFSFLISSIIFFTKLL